MFIEILLTIIKTWKQAKCPSIDEWIKKIWCMCVCIYTCAVLSHSVVSNSLGSHGLQPSRLLCPWGFSRQEYWSTLPYPPPGNLPNLGIEPRFPTLQVDSLPVEPQGKPKNTGMGSLFLLQGIFPTQELNWGRLHYRWILYQLSYQGSVHMHTYIHWNTTQP